MNKPFILIEHDGGECKVEAFNFKGSACEVATRAFKEAIGSVKTSKKKAEFYQGQAAGLQQQVGK